MATLKFMKAVFELQVSKVVEKVSQMNGGVRVEGVTRPQTLILDPRPFTLTLSP